MSIRLLHEQRRDAGVVGTFPHFRNGEYLLREGMLYATSHPVVELFGDSVRRTDVA